MKDHTTVFNRHNVYFISYPTDTFADNGILHRPIFKNFKIRPENASFRKYRNIELAFLFLMLSPTCPERKVGLVNKIQVLRFFQLFFQGNIRID